MQKPLLRIPYPGPFPLPRIIPMGADSLTGALSALTNFLLASPSKSLPSDVIDPASTVVLSGAGLSVASGLADYRGPQGTYRLNKTYRPIYYHEFLASHEARKRYWSRSFIGWADLQNAKPNCAQYAIKDLGAMRLVRSVITQNVDSFHPIAHPNLPTLELHGYLRTVRCTSCNNEIPRNEFQDQLKNMNPSWAEFLTKVLASGAFQTRDPVERRLKGFSTNPDGDASVPGAHYSSFRYPACPNCMVNPPKAANGSNMTVDVDSDGSWKIGSTAGILKPSVVMFGESISSRVKETAQQAIDGSGRLLILGTSLATYSAWSLAKRAKERGMPIGIINLGGVRGEDLFFQDVLANQCGEAGVRTEVRTEEILPKLVEHFKQNYFLMKG